MKVFYAYMWLHDDLPIYVGKGTGSRFMQHIGRDDFPEPGPTLQPRIYWCSSEDEARELEAQLYAHCKKQGFNLLNKQPVISSNVEYIDYEPPQCVFPFADRNSYDFRGKETTLEVAWKTLKDDFLERANLSLDGLVARGPHRRFSKRYFVELVLLSEELRLLARQIRREFPLHLEARLGVEILEMARQIQYVFQDVARAKERRELAMTRFSYGEPKWFREFLREVDPDLEDEFLHSLKKVS